MGPSAFRNEFFGQIDFTVILDGSLPFGSPALIEQCLKEPPAERLALVSVSCSTEDLRRREAVRPEPRESGCAEAQAATINDGLNPLVQVDTTAGDTRRHVESIVAVL